MFGPKETIVKARSLLKFRRVPHIEEEKRKPNRQERSLASLLAAAMRVNRLLTKNEYEVEEVQENKRHLAISGTRTSFLSKNQLWGVFIQNEVFIRLTGVMDGKQGFVSFCVSPFLSGCL